MPETPRLDTLAQQVHARLLAAFGTPTWRLPLPPIDELVSTILSQNTNDRNRDLAFDSLKAKFPDWNDVIAAPAEQIIAAIQIAGLANQKGPRIQNVLKLIQSERGNLDLTFLKDLPKEEARKWLLKFNGVGPKTAAIVLQFSLGVPAFPVDTHIYRITGRIGLRSEHVSVEDTHVLMESIFPPETYYPGHLNLIRLGREICSARNPKCGVCPLLELCRYGQNIKK